METVGDFIFGRLQNHLSSDGDCSHEIQRCNLNIQKTKILAFSPITSWCLDEETMETVTDYFLGLQNHCSYGDCSHEIKGTCSLEEKL